MRELITKILFVLGFSNPFPGAAWTRTGFFAQDWSTKECSVDVLGVFSYNSLRKKGWSNVGNVNIYNLIFNVGLTHPLIFIFNSIISYIFSILFIIVRKPHVVIVSVPNGSIGLGTLIACQLTRVKCVVDYRDEWEDYTIYLSNSNIGKSFYSIVKKLVASIYAKCHFTVAVTPNFLSSLKSRGVTNVKVIPNGSDINIFKPYYKKGVKEKLKITKDDFIIVYNGGIGEYYRLDIVVRALTKLDASLRDKVKLFMVGGGQDLPNIMSMAKTFGLENRVLPLGIKNDKTELAELLSVADVGVIPYDDNSLWRNTIPAKFFEYCACGLPVIATTYEDSLLAGLIRSNKLGMVSSPLDEGGLANAIYQLYKNDSFRKAAGKKARKLIEENFDRKRIAIEFLNLIRKIN